MIFILKILKSKLYQNFNYLNCFDALVTILDTNLLKIIQYLLKSLNAGRCCCLLLNAGQTNLFILKI